MANIFAVVGFPRSFPIREFVRHRYEKYYQENSTIQGFPERVKFEEYFTGIDDRQSITFMRL